VRGVPLRVVVCVVVLVVRVFVCVTILFQHVGLTGDMYVCICACACLHC